MDGLGERIHAIRKSRNLTQQQFADQLSVSRPFISRIESGKESPSDSLLKLISLQFDVSYEWITGGKGSMFTVEINQMDIDIAEVVGRGFVDMLNRVGESVKHCNAQEKIMVYDVLMELADILSLKAKSTSQKTIALETIRDIFCQTAFLMKKCLTLTVTGTFKEEWLDNQYRWFTDNYLEFLSKAKSEFLYSKDE